MRREYATAFGAGLAGMDTFEERRTSDLALMGVPAGSFELS